MGAVNNNTVYAAALLVLILIAGIGVISYKWNSEDTTMKTVPTVGAATTPPKASSTSGVVSIDILEPKTEAPEGGE